MENSKKYDELVFTDDFMFCKVLSNNLPLCARVISLILGIPVKEVKLSESQKPIEITADGRGIRLDVYVEDEAGTVFDLEMQTVTKKDIPKRSRYYQGLIDLNLIQRGALFSELRESYVIFICLDDEMFGKGLPVYTFRNTCLECPKLIFGDNTTKIVVNAASEDTSMTSDMRQFLGFLLKGTGESELVRDIMADVEKARNREEWRVEFMTLLMRDNEKRAEGRAEGESRFASLMRELIASNRYDDIDKAINSSDERERLYQEFGIT